MKVEMDEVAVVGTGVEEAMAKKSRLWKLDKLEQARRRRRRHFYDDDRVGLSLRCSQGCSFLVLYRNVESNY